MLSPGDPLPSFHVAACGNPQFSFDSVAGRHVVVSFIGSGRANGAADFIAAVKRLRSRYDDRFACCFIVSSDPADEGAAQTADRYPGVRFLWDRDGAMARRFGCLEVSAPAPGSGAGPAPGAAAAVPASGGLRIRLATFLLDPGLRVHAVLPVRDLRSHHDGVAALLASLPEPEAMAPASAPVLTVPRVFEPAFCRELLAYAGAHPLEDSGFMRTDPATGQTVLVVDHGHKRRRDCVIGDERLRQALQRRILRRLVPAVTRAFQFKATRMERYLIACYDADGGGHFRPHKDNTTQGTAHRRFAVSIGLDADGYDGGDLRFPEFGARTYRPATGGAIVFSCSLLHEVLPVTRGRRFAFLPFLYDEAAAALRLANARHLQDDALRAQVLASVQPGSA